ncbi:MAG TPA: hypothetical protein VGZ22_09820 [Isosphaeraceae bacterium]|jgi:hypothetical protein|nr:hypothetical protein [Isosphaeraceae bacterium]
MRKLVPLALAIWFATGLAGRTRADDDPKEIIAKSIKAHGGEEQLAKRNSFRTKSKGSLDIGEVKTTFTNEVSMKVPDQIKSSIQISVQGQDISVVQVFNDGKGWVSANGTKMELKDRLLEEMKESLYASKVELLTPLLKEKGFTLSSLGETMVADKPAVGVRVSSEGHKDIELYFDKENSLPVKRGRTSLDGATMKDVFQEAYYSDFKEFDGLKVPTRIVLHNDGKKFLEMDVTDFEVVEKFNDDEFAMP